MSLIQYFVRRPDFDVFQMLAEHLPAVARIHSAAFRHAWSESECHALLVQESVFGFVARQNNAAGTPATGGFVLVRSGGGEAEILTIGVDPKYRRCGLGWRLMRAALGQARQQDAEAMFLEVDQGNAPAIALYCRLGFRKVGERKAYYKPSGPNAEAGGADIMRLDLRAQG
jgi:ribosomal-protein-alanine N-acetyltransferase